MHTHRSQTILCPVDFSQLSAHALRHAARLARCGDSRILAVYANWFEAPPYFTEGRVAELQKEFREAVSEAQRMLNAFVASALPPGASQVGASRVETRVVEALPVDAIRSLAASTSAAMVVMGTHGRSGFNRWTLGSVAERVLREVPVPVLTVRAAPQREIRHILCPVSDSPASRGALAKAADLAACFDATVTALHVREASGAAAIPDLCAWVPAEERTRCNIREMVLDGNAAEEIVRLASAEPYDLLVLGAPRRRFFEGMVLGTTTLRAVRHAACPVLSVPEPEAPPVQ
jgi:nucleotide-binding universal stress UspA family protein